MEQRLREQADEIDVLHLACHGNFRSDDPLKSGILLADANHQERSDEPDSNILTAEEIFGFKLPVDLVTLSCCETGINENRSGDELIGLTRALIYAGVASVIASLWSVNDLSTRILMERFYSELKAGYHKVHALQRAQLFVMKMTVGQRQQYLSLYGKRNVKLVDVDGRAAISIGLPSSTSFTRNPQIRQGSAATISPEKKSSKTAVTRNEPMNKRMIFFIQLGLTVTGMQ